MEKQTNQRKIIQDTDSDNVCVDVKVVFYLALKRSEIGRSIHTIK